MVGSFARSFVRLLTGGSLVRSFVRPFVIIRFDNAKCVRAFNLQTQSRDINMDYFTFSDESEK
jgi:hypothetical protein